jgi:hypothetical protein
MYTYKTLIISIIILLIAVNTQNSRSFYNTVRQKGGGLEDMALDLGGSKKSVILSKLGSLKSGVGNKLGAVGKINFFTTALGWMFGLLQTFAMFGGLVIALAVLPALPLFIFMLILFFILRARMAFIKEL